MCLCLFLVSENLELGVYVQLATLKILVLPEQQMLKCF